MSRSRFARSLGSALVVAGMACDDGGTAPSALLVAEETQAALQVARELPTLPRLVSRAMTSDAAPETATLLQARSLWLEAEGVSAVEDARRLRDEAHALAAPELARVLTPSDLLAVQDSMRQWIRLASGVPGIGQVGGIGAALDEAALLLDLGARAEPADHVGAVELTLRAGDALLRTTPRAVASRLIAEAEASAALLPPEQDGERGDRVERLIRGAREAYRSADYLLAIRRAFYAGQLTSQR